MTFDKKFCVNLFSGTIPVLTPCVKMVDPKQNLTENTYLKKFTLC